MHDFIVIGAGSAGCAVAARSSENGENDVLLLEAGPPDSNEAIHVPAAFPSLFKGEADWSYATTPQRHAHDRQEYLPRGKVLGGSSSINVADLRDPNPLSFALVEAARQIGVPTTDGFNAGEQVGIGPPDQLGSHGIRVVRPLPGVGENLGDHLFVSVAYHCTQPITLAARQTEEQLLKFQRERKGLLTSNVAEAGGFMRIDPAAPAADLQFIFGPIWYFFHGMRNPTGHGFTLLPCLVQPKSLGRVTLRSSDPLDAPVIDHNYLAKKEDLELRVQGVRIARRLLEAPAFDALRRSCRTSSTQTRTRLR